MSAPGEPEAAGGAARPEPRPHGFWNFTLSDKPAVYPVGRTVTIIRTAGAEHEFDMHWLTDSGFPAALLAVPYDEAQGCLQGSGITGTGPGGEALYDVTICPFDPHEPGKHHKSGGDVKNYAPAAADGGGLAGLWGADAKPPGSDGDGGR